MYFGALNERVKNLYSCGCDTCSEINLALNDNKPVFKDLLNAVEAAYQKLHENGTYKPSDIKNTDAYKQLISATNGVLKQTITDNDIPAEMLRALQNDVFLFSALKTHAQLFEASRLLLDENKQVKPFNKFLQDVKQIKSNYNESYLEAEYIFATTSAQMAGKWADIQQNDGKYNLQYRTAKDEKVRETHRALDEITLPADDTFWNSYYPPNGWRCRCNAVEVLKGKHQVSDSKKSIEAGEAATTQIGKDGKNRFEIFRFNPGKQKVIFPPKHPYNKLSGSDVIKDIVKSELNTMSKELKTLDHLNERISEFAKEHPEYFARGFRKIAAETNRNYNGSTDLNGNIKLRKERIDDVIDAFNNIRLGKPTTLKQEDEISTLHHEMWHNANKPGNMILTKKSTRFMELANEFVSRKTLKDFMSKIGGKLQNEILSVTRTSTGYNTMVENYQELIKWTKCKEADVVNTVKKHLIEERYNTQIDGLIKGIETNSEFKISGKTVGQLIRYAEVYTKENFAKLLEANEKLLIKK